MAKDLTHRIAWQGFEFWIPEDWDLDAVRGDEENGYLQVSDGQKFAMELRWNTSKKGPELRQVLERYEKKLNKQGGRHGPNIQLEPAASLEDRDDGSRRHFTARTEGRGRLYGFAGWCARSHRILMAQITSAKPALGHKILDSLSDRLHEPGWNEWSLYGLDIALPEEYILIDRRLVAGFISLHFAAGKREYAVERWGPASELLRGRTLEDWIVESRAARDTTITESLTGERAEHEAVEITGRRKVHWRKPKVRRSRWPKRWACRLWVCEPSNRIFAEHYFHSRRDDAWLDEIGVVCHSPADRAE